VPLQADIKAGQADLFHACRHSLAHGVLLALHYLAPLVPWAGAVGDQGHAAAMRPWLQGLLQLLEEASELALEHLSKPQDSNIGEDHTHNPELWLRFSHNLILHQHALLRAPTALHPLAFRQEEEIWMVHHKAVGQGYV
jgi:hypothetical protein